MFKLFKSKSTKMNTDTNGLREDIHEMVSAMDQGALFAIVDSRYPSDPMKEAYKKKIWRDTCSSSTVNLKRFPDNASLRSFSKRSSITSSSESVLSSYSEENMIQLKNGFQLVLNRDKQNDHVEVRVFRDGRLLKRREVAYHLTLAQKYQDIISQQLSPRDLSKSNNSLSLSKY